MHFGRREQFEDFLRGLSLLTVVFQGVGAVAFGEAFAGFIFDAGVVKVDGSGKAEDGLELAVDVGCVEKILTAGDVGDVLECIIDDYGQVVGDADVFAGDDIVTVL